MPFIKTVLNKGTCFHGNLLQTLKKFRGTGRGGSIEESGTTTFGTCCAERFLANLGCPQAQTRRLSKP